MTDLNELVPPHEPAEDALVLAGGLALDAIPVVGPMATRALDHALAARDRDRRHEFDLAVVEEVQRLARQVDESLTVADVVESDDFLAAFNRGRRAAAETASAVRRRRLATAVAHSGSWARFSESERHQFGRLAEEFSDLHVWLLVYLDDRGDWRRSHGVDETKRYEPTNENPLTQVFGVEINQWWGAFAQAVDDLERERLVVIQRELADAHAKQLHARTVQKGVQFRAFLNEPAPEEVVAPTL